MVKYDGQTCLIVDDFSTARRLIKNSLGELGFSCIEAEDGEQALDIILHTQLTLVLADVNMPNKNGLELLEDIRNDDNFKDMHVILTMIEPLETLISTGTELGMSDYLVKPFDVFTLAKVLDKVIITQGGESL